MFILPEVLDELVILRTKAKDAATSFTEAIKAQAADHEVGKGGLEALCLRGGDGRQREDAAIGGGD